jgi:AraC-like DNA-binding protein
MSIPTTRRGRLLLERRVLPARDGLIGLAQKLVGSDTRALVTHGAFVLTRVEVRKGRVSFPLHSQRIEAPDRFLLALPPRSVLPMTFHEACVCTDGVAGFAPLLTDGPLLLAWDGDEPLLDLEAVRRALAAPFVKRLDADAGVPPAIARARGLLHDLIAHPAPVRMAARRVGLRPETLSRGFGEAYTVPPKRYCHGARLFEAVLRILSGATIRDAALTAGFQDLKRFYTQFGRQLGTTPGSYAHVKKRQDIARDGRL